MTDIIKVWEERVEEQKLYRKLEKEAHEKQMQAIKEQLKLIMKTYVYPNIPNLKDIVKDEVKKVFADAEVKE